MQHARYLAVSVPVYQWGDLILDEEEDLEGHMPCRRGDLWEPIIELSTGQVINWSAGHTARVLLKTRDEGLYWLLDEHQARIARWKDAYVPSALLYLGAAWGAGRSGDYIDLRITTDGKLLNWTAPVLQTDDWRPLTALDVPGPHTKVSRVPVTLEQQLTHRELAPGVSAFELVRRCHPMDSVPGWCRGSLPNSRTTGITATADVQRFLAGECGELRADPHWRIVSPDYLQMAQQQGYLEAESDLDLEPALAAANQAPLAMPEGWSVARNDFSKNLLFGADGNPLPVAIRFDGIIGMMNDRCYDIPRLVDYLSQHPQVHPSKLSDPARLEIETCSGYAARLGFKLQTSFVFVPSVLQMHQLWAQAQQIDPSYPSTALYKAIFELDLLGVRAQGLASSDRYGDAES